MAVDVLQNDDRIVDDQAHRQNDAEHGQHVDGESHEVDEEERADEGHRNGHGRNQGGANAAQEQENHQHDQHQCLYQGSVDGIDRGFHELRGIDRRPHPHAVGQPALEARQDFLDAARNFKCVGGGLLDHAEGDPVGAVDADDLAVFVRPRLGETHILELDLVATHLGDDHLVELLGALEVGFGKHGELAVGALDAAAR